MTRAADPPPDLVLDVRGFHCPLPVLKTRKALSTLAPGALVQVLASDPAARIDMAHYCATSGHTLVEMREADALLVFLIRKGELSSS